MRVLYLAAEATPLVKIGGLADVAGSLPGALRRLKGGPDVRLALPFHRSIDLAKSTLEKVADLDITARLGTIPAQAYRIPGSNPTIYLIDSPLIPEDGRVYSEHPGLDGLKYIHFSLAALELVRRIDWQPDILHANDWHTAAAVYGLSLRRPTDLFFNRTASLITIHNLAYQGNGAGPALEELGLPIAQDERLPWWTRDWPLPLALLTADGVNTVSEGYAAEILTEEFGAGLAGFLAAERGSELVGILNGLDQPVWDPGTDPALVETFGVDSLLGKKLNKRALQHEMGLPDAPKTPLLGMVSRLDPQKGIDLAIDALRLIPDLEWQAVLLGSGDSNIEAAAHELQSEWPERFRFVTGYNDPLSRRIYAGSDLFLIPSRYEPCGLTQMIAMRYGSAPVARAVGGLRDTIQPYPDDPVGTGFLFASANAAALAVALRNALAFYPNWRRWQGIKRRGMKQNFSWEPSARKYLDLYKKLIARRQALSN